MSEEFFDGRVVLLSGDCRDVLKTLPDNSFDSCVTDPPYALVSIVKRFGKPNSAPVKVADIKASNCLKAAYARASSGFMGKTWDTGETAFSDEFWAEALRVLKPGAHLASFGSTRTYHRMACAIEDAGFEIRDSLMWLYGSGFPKSHSMRDIGHPELGTALKPAVEPIVLARKPLSEKTVAANVLRWGTGALNIDGCRVAGEPTGIRNNNVSLGSSSGGIYGSAGGFVSEGHSAGRWPANVVHDGSDEVVGAFPNTVASKAGMRGLAGRHDPGQGAEHNRIKDYSNSVRGHADNGGSAARFFYSAKADGDDRIGSSHPTVKPVDLMQWLVRLVTPPGGRTLEPFAGTGTTAEAAYREGMSCTLIEIEEESRVDIRRRMRLCNSGKSERRRESIKAKLNGKAIDHGPLFEVF
jgi:site-specific DNA-methyltransferase (adenine-specific)